MLLRQAASYQEHYPIQVRWRTYPRFALADDGKYANDHQIEVVDDGECANNHQTQADKKTHNLKRRSGCVGFSLGDTSSLPYGDVRVSLGRMGRCDDQ